jgi:hypothetical protein
MKVENIRGISFVSSHDNVISYLLKTLDGDYLTSAIGGPLKFDAKGRMVFMGEPRRAYRLPAWRAVR